MESVHSLLAKFHTLSSEEKLGDAEEQLFASQVEELEQRWATPRWSGIQRPYTARDIISKRGSLTETHASSLMARKLFNLIQRHLAEGTAATTLGIIDPAQMSQMAGSQEFVYVSGWTCSSVASTTNEVSPDLADYPYTTVPAQVHRMFKAELMHDRKHWDARSKLSAEEKKKTPYKDYLMPIIADGDAGHGGLTAVMKLAKLFAESGASCIHIEDQVQGAKKCGHLAGKVVVPVGEQIDRLIAARFQWDLMNAETLLMARTDCLDARLINSTVDIRDHDYILGVTDEKLTPFAEALFMLEAKGTPTAEIDAFEESWLKSANLVSFNEAAIEHLARHGVSQHDIDEYVAKTRTLSSRSITARRQLVQGLVDKPFFFSWDIPRTREGFYRYRGCHESVTERLIAFAPYAELLGAETPRPDVASAGKLADSVRKVFPEKGFVYNLSPSFNWTAAMSPEELKSFSGDLAKFGFVLQICALAGFHSTARMTAELSRRFKDDGMLAYVELVQAREKELGIDALTHQKWSGIEYVQGILDSIHSGNSSTRMNGSANTENQFA